MNKYKCLHTLGLLVVSAAAWWTFLYFTTDRKLLGCAIHVMFFAPFAFFLLKTIEVWRGRTLPVWVVWLLPAGIALALEYIQRWTPPHNPEWAGLTASLLGVVIGVLIHQTTTKQN